jgi:hypothetical protein
MAVLQPFDKHPANPGTLRGTSTTLASDAEAALTLDGGTQRAYAPVTTHWNGIGKPEASGSAQKVKADAADVRGGVAAAAVALGSWSGSVHDFNAEVDRILATVNAAGKATAVEGQTPEQLATANTTAKATAHRQGEADWHTAYDTYIVTGGLQAARMLKEGPSTADLLRLFQAGLLPIAAVNLFPKVDFGKTDWRKLFANLRALGLDPLNWATLGTYDPAELKKRLDLLRGMGVPPTQYKDLLQLYWVSVAAQKAGIDLSQWDPNKGANGLKDIITKVYTYYGNLFLQNPYMQWAGMANMIGPSFAAGFFDLSLFRKLAQAVEHQPGLPIDMRVLANISDSELKFFETTFLSMQKDIFYDQAMMHEAYLGGGMDSIKELEAAGLIDPRTQQAWGQIDEGRRTGNQDLIKAGNTALLYREQHDVIDQNYQKMYDHPVTGPAFTYMMTAVGEPSIPGAKSFADYKPLWVEFETPGPKHIPFTNWDNPTQGEIDVKTPLPDGNIAHFQDRWDYISKDTLPAYQKELAEHPDQAREIVGQNVSDRIDDYRIYNRIDSLVEQFATDWRVEFHQ